MVLVAAAAVTGCGGRSDPGPSPLPASVNDSIVEDVPCLDLFADGVTTDPDAFDVTCSAEIAGATSLAAFPLQIEECSDGRQLAHNAIGWGYVGEPWNLTGATEDVWPVPTYELDRCRR